MNFPRWALLRFALAVVSFIAADQAATTCRAQNEGTLSEPFTGRIVFHQKDGGVSYDVTITEGEVGGRQLFNSEPIAKIVGGWFDYKKGRLSLLIQGTAKDMAPEWRSQCQQFSIDLKTKDVTLEHALYSFGSTSSRPLSLTTEHALDSLDASVRLVE